MTRRELVQGIALTSAGAARPARAQGTRVQIGLVGGRFGATFQWHLDPDCEVAAVFDIDPQRLARL